MKVYNFVIFLILVSSLVYAQSPLVDAIGKSDIIVEGIVTNQSSVELDDGNIYTLNEVATSKSFKGDVLDTVVVITRGGSVNNKFQIYSHHMNFNIGDEGIFLCEEIYLNSDFSFPLYIVKDNINFAKFYKEDTGYTSTLGSIAELYITINNNVGVNYVENGLNSFQKAASPSLFRSVNDTSILFLIENPTIVDGGSKVNFDIYVQSNINGIKFASTELIVDYNQSAFGSFVVANNKINVEERIVIQSNNYSTSVSDEEVAKVKISTESNIQVDQLNVIGSVPKKFCNVEIEIDDIAELANLSFDATSMQDKSYFYDPSSQSYIKFNRVFVKGEIESLLMPSIISFTPSNVSAGTGDVLTITGSMFGSTPGIVRFKNADDGGITEMQTLPPDFIINGVNEWTDTEIKLLVPSIETSSGIAGSGVIEVETSTGLIASTQLLSPSALNVDYSVINFRTGANRAIRVSLADPSSNNVGDGNSDGKLIFTRNVSVSNDALEIIEQALCDWNSVSGINWAIEDQISVLTSHSDNDGKNLIYFGSSTDFASTGSNTLAFTVHTGVRLSNGCNDGAGGNPSYRTDVDIVLRGDLLEVNPPVLGGWYFETTGNPSPIQLDFYSIILHELGHAHLLDHAIPEFKQMWWADPPGSFSRIIDGFTALGSQDVMNHATNTLIGFCPLPVATGTCLTSSNNIASSEKIKVYPNPFSTNIIIEDIENTGAINVEVIAINGEVITRREITPLQESISVDIQSKLPAGIYLIKISTRQGVFIKKIVKN